MENNGLKYKVIKTRSQYDDYCSLLEELVRSNDPAKQDEIDMLELLIDVWDQNNSPFSDYDPVQLVEALLTENNMKQIDLAQQIGISESYLSEVLSYKKSMSKKIIRKLSELFAIRQEALLKPYPLKKTSGLQQLAATVSHMIDNSGTAFVFQEPPLVYGKKIPEVKQNIRKKGKQK